MRTLFDQLTEDERCTVALLIGADSKSVRFRNILRETPALPGSFTLGEAAESYCTQILKFLKKETTA